MRWPAAARSSLGALGAVLLLVTPPSFFAHLVPWLVLFATAVFAWGSFVPRRTDAGHLHRLRVIVVQFLISIYGGYFGGNQEHAGGRHERFCGRDIRCREFKSGAVDELP